MFWLLQNISHSKQAVVSSYWISKILIVAPSMSSHMSDLVGLTITLHAHAQAGLYVIGAGVHLYIVYMWPPPKSLNGTLAIDSPFQTLGVRLLVKFID